MIGARPSQLFPEEEPASFNITRTADRSDKRSDPVQAEISERRNVMETSVLPRRIPGMEGCGYHYCSPVGAWKPWIKEYCLQGDDVVNAGNSRMGSRAVHIPSISMTRREARPSSLSSKTGVPTQSPTGPASLSTLMALSLPADAFPPMRPWEYGLQSAWPWGRRRGCSKPLQAI